MLNVALFGKTAKQWREENPDKKGNIRDYATIHQLLILANLESYNAILTSKYKNLGDRLPLLREMVIKQIKALSSVDPDLPKMLDSGE
jgi:hypothetical protein